MRFDTRPEEDYSLSLTALIDVVFLLLIFFMVSTAFIDFSRRMDIRLPEAKTGTVTGEPTRQLLIEVGGQGRITLNGKQVTLAGLEAEMEGTRGLPERTVLIRADRRLPYGLVIRIMGICRAAGIYDIGVAVKGPPEE
ncbi:MAG: ExbD/TolR family protein [Nitrospinota bacterium]